MTDRGKYTHTHVRVLANPGPRPRTSARGEPLAGELAVELPEGGQARLHLHEAWGDLLGYCWPGAELGLRHVLRRDGGGVHLLATADSYVVLEPHVLVNPSAIRQMDGCPRKYYTRKRQGDSHQSQALIRGSVVNEIFDRLLQDSAQNLDVIREEVLRAQTLALACLPDGEVPFPAKFRAEVDEHLAALADWIRHEPRLIAEERSLEPTLISPKYGLAGRLDLLLSPGPRATTYELKTSKPPAGRPWPDDELQVAAYQLLLESVFGCRNPDSYLLYSRSAAGQVARQVAIHPQRRRHVVRLRNRMVALDHALALGEAERAASPAASAVPQVEAGDCDSCRPWIKQPCLETCRVMQEKPCASCTQRLSCAGRESKAEADLAYYHRNFRLIELERAAARRAYARNWLDLPGLLADGKALGGLRYAGGEGYEVSFGCAAPNHASFRSGDLVLLHPGDLAGSEVYKTTIEEIGRDGVRLALKKWLPAERWLGREWTLCPDSMETSFSSQQTALYRWLGPCNARQRDLVLGRAAPRFDEARGADLAALPLNETQRHAVARALQAEDYLLIQGPPGTGKTHTLAHLIAQLAKRGDRVLLCAFTHRAVDNVLAKLVWDIGYDDFVRLGSPGAVDRALHRWRLEQRHPAAVLEDLPRLQAALQRERVVACTAIAAVTHGLVQKLAFDTVVVDEASQLTEPGTLAAIGRGARFILVGDHQQLPSVIQSEAAQADGLSTSLFQRLATLNEGRPGVLVTLLEQYRMHEELMAFSNARFYQGRLRAHPGNASATLAVDASRLPVPLRHWLAPQRPLVFLDVPGDHPEPLAAEAGACEAIVAALLRAGVAAGDIGVITPFRAQVAEIARRVAAGGASDALLVDTVDRFQGNDRDVILFSCAVADPALLDSFVGEARRLNVTVTRAKKKLIIIGRGDVLRRNPLFADLLARAACYAVATKGIMNVR